MKQRREDMPVYTQEIKQTEAGLEVINMVDGRPDPCSDCWNSCQRCPYSPAAELATVAEQKEFYEELLSFYGI